MSYKNYHPHSQNPEDVSILEGALAQYRGGTCRFLEIGVLNGQTARGVKMFCDENGICLEYCGIDPMSPEHHGAPREPFQGAKFIQGDSAECFHLVPSELDVVLVDGCHCINHVILDTFHYGSRVVPFGFMLFHDTHVPIQQTMRDPHGPDIPEFYNSVLKAHALIGFPFLPWKFIVESIPVNRPWGGMTCFRKMDGP